MYLHNSGFESAVLTNQLISNIQLGRINSQLDQLLQAVREAKAEADRLARNRDIVFTVRQALEPVQQMVATYPAF